MKSRSLAVAMVVILVLVVAAYLYARPPVTVSAVKYAYTGSVAGVFFKVRNLGLREVCIVGARIEGVNAMVELHKTVEEGGKVKMVPVTGCACSPLGASSSGMEDTM